MEPARSIGKLGFKRWYERQLIEAHAWHALERYGALMKEAERFSERSTCASCGVYAVFHVIAEYPNRMRVRCRKCSHEWLLG